MLYTEIITTCSKVHTKPIRTVWAELRISECYTLWYVKLPVGFKGLNEVERKIQNNLMLNISGNGIFWCKCQKIQKISYE